MHKSFKCPMNMTLTGVICCPHRLTAQPGCLTNSHDLPWGCSLLILASWPGQDDLWKTRATCLGASKDEQVF